MVSTAAVPAFRYRAFISYSHQDKPWADWLHKALETYRVPARLVGTATPSGPMPARLAPIFRDRDELPSAHNLGDKVDEALAQSANLIVICSPRSAASRWVDAEVMAFKRMGHADRIFCLIVDGEPNASTLSGREAKECFAHALRFTVDAHGQLTDTPTEPIAADARPGMDGKSNAKLKLIAGLLDLDYDRLKQRELKRRNRRLAAIAAAALVATALTTSLAITALIARHAAVVASQAAVRRQKQAEDLVGFMLGDLSDKLSQVQRLDIMEAVDDHAMAYFQSLPTTDVTDAALAQRAKTLEQIGDVRQRQGHLPAALASYQAAARLSGALANAAPTDTTRQIAYAQALAYVGMTRWYQGQLDTAQQSFASAQTVLRHAASRTAHNPTLQYELAMFDNNIGHVLEARGRFDEATLQYQDMLALCRLLVAAKPDQAEWTLTLGEAHNNLGKMALLRGDLATAVAEYAADDTIETALAARNPKDNTQRESMLIVHAILGRTLALGGDNEAGMHDLQQAVDIATQLSKVDPDNSGFQEDMAQYSAQLARLRRLHGDLPTAQTLTAQSLAIYRALTKSDPSNASWQQEFAEAQREQAEQSRASGLADAARTQAQAALARLTPLFAKQPDDRGTLLATLGAKLSLANVSTDATVARQLRVEVLQSLQAQPGGRGDPRLLALQVQALLALGRKAEAEPAIRQLWRSGYRDAGLLAVLQHERIAYPANLALQQRITEAVRNGTIAANHSPARTAN